MVSEGGGASDTTVPAKGSSSGTDVAIRDYIDSMRNADRHTNNQMFTRLHSEIVALEKLTDQKFDLNDKALIAALLAAKEAVDKALTAAKEAVDKAELAASKRFEATNEFRGQLADQAVTFQRLDLAKSDKDAIQREIAINRDDIASLRSSVAGSLRYNDGEQHQKQNSRDSNNTFISVVGLFIFVVVPLASFLLSRIG